MTLRVEDVASKRNHHPLVHNNARWGHRCFCCSIGLSSQHNIEDTRDFRGDHIVDLGLNGSIGGCNISCTHRQRADWQSQLLFSLVSYHISSRHKAEQYTTIWQQSIHTSCTSSKDPILPFLLKLFSSSQIHIRKPNFLSPTLLTYKPRKPSFPFCTSTKRSTYTREHTRSTSRRAICMYLMAEGNFGLSTLNLSQQLYN